MADDSSSKLRGAGIDVDKLPAAQQAALADLSGDEVDTVVRVTERLRSAGGEVTGQAMAADDTGVFYY